MAGSRPSPEIKSACPECGGSGTRVLPPEDLACAFDAIRTEDCPCKVKARGRTGRLSLLDFDRVRARLGDLLGRAFGG